MTSHDDEDCAEERLVTSNDGDSYDSVTSNDGDSYDSITYCDRCTQLQSCAVCTSPYFPGDGATMCLACMSTGMEVASEDSLDNGMDT